MLDTSAAEAFDDQLVPRVFGPWAEFVVAHAAPAPLDCVLDVACATGAAARAASRTARRVVAIDIDPAMVAVASRRFAGARAPIEWHCGDALRLPFRAAAFDLCFCLQGLQFFPDAHGALNEMRRVLKGGAGLYASVWAHIEHVPGHRAVAEALEDEGIDAGPIRRAFALGDPACVRALLEAAGYGAITLSSEERVATFPSVDVFVAMLSAGGAAGADPLGRLDPAHRERFHRTVARRLKRFDVPDGLRLPYRAHLAVARTPRGQHVPAARASDHR